MKPSHGSFLACPAKAFGKPVCRLGLASRGRGALTPDDVLWAIDWGVNFLNWPGESEGPTGADAMSETIANMGADRERLVVCVQFAARTEAEAAGELRGILTTLRTDYIDVLTFYYVEQAEEWAVLSGESGALGYCQAAQRDGVARKLGVTSHQRPLAASMAQSRLLDSVMIRYNAAHRGAEREVFPVTDSLGVPVIAYTALRWERCCDRRPTIRLRSPSARAREWYRFVLQSSSVSVVLSAPESRTELAEDFTVLRANGPLSDEEYTQLAEHGERVRRHAGRFP